MLVALLVMVMVPAPEVRTSVDRSCSNLSCPPAVPLAAKPTLIWTLPPLALMVALLPPTVPTPSITSPAEVKAAFVTE